MFVNMNIVIHIKYYSNQRNVFVNINIVIYIKYYSHPKEYVC